MSDDGKRRFERTEFKAKGSITVKNEDCPFEVVNISLKGVFIKTEDDIALKEGDAYPLRISLPYLQNPIETEAVLAHNHGEYYGLCFNTISADGMIHLRRLLELNARSCEQVEKELQFLLND